MKRVTAYITGNVHRAGYRGKVIAIANDFGLKGNVQNLEDGRVKVIAEGEEETLGYFIKALETNESIITMCDFSDTSSSFDGFEKDCDLKLAFLGICDIIAYKPDYVRQILSELQESVDKLEESTDNLKKSIEKSRGGDR